MSENTKNNPDIVPFLIFAFSALAFIGGLLWGVLSTEHKYQSSAVKNGVGEWVVDKDKTVSFKWKKND